jgi:hypothetical protein
MCSMDSRVYIERPNAWVRVCSNVSLETAVHTGLIGPRRPQDWFLKRLQGWANPSSRGLWGGDAALHRCFWRCQRSTPAGQRSRWGEGREHHRARAGGNLFRVHQLTIILPHISSSLSRGGAPPSELIPGARHPGRGPCTRGRSTCPTPRGGKMRCGIAEQETDAAGAKRGASCVWRARGR